jgi:hypothetical protein
MCSYRLPPGDGSDAKVSADTESATDAVNELVTRAQRPSGLDSMRLASIARRYNAVATSLAVSRLFRKWLSQISLPAAKAALWLQPLHPHEIYLYFFSVLTNSMRGGKFLR